MALTHAQRLDRLKARTLELSFWRDRESVEIGGWTVDGAPIGKGEAWPTRQGVVHFDATAEAPAHWPLEDIRLELNLGGEGLITLGPGGSFGLDPFHQQFPVKA